MFFSVLGEKPYLCTQCGASFIQTSHLKEHIRRHSDERPYPCTQCDLSFKHKSTLKSHITIHTGEKPHKCTVCAYACRQVYSLKKHMLQHESKNWEHQCTECSKRFPELSILQTHVEHFHNLKKDELNIFN